MKKRQRFRLLSVIILFFFITGCEISSQPVIDENEADKGFYSILELTPVADPEKALERLAEEVVTREGLQYTAGRLEMCGGNLYRQLKVLDEDGFTQGIWLLSLKHPYDEWSVTSIPARYEEDGRQYVISNIYFLEGEPAFCTLLCRNDNRYYLGACGEDGVEEVKGIFPEKLENYSLRLSGNGQAYAYNRTEGNLVILDDGLRIQEERTFQGQIYDVLPNSKASDVYLYAYDEKGAGIWEISKEECMTRLENWDEEAYRICVSYDGNIYWANREKLWRYNNTGAQLLCTFSESDYVLNAIYGLEMNEDKGVRMLVQIGGEYYMLRAGEDTEGETEKKREIEIAFGQNHIGLQRVIAAFNRQSDTWRIVTRLPQEDEELADYWDRLQLEISAGKGPDIISDEAIWDAEVYIQNGYFEKLDGVLEDESQYLPAALEGSRRNGALYGMPYDCQLFFATYSRKLSGKRSSWTVPELMEAVKNSEARILQCGCDGVDIVKYYGLFDNENTIYIDWEQGESHLTEEPFLELLDFALNYADTRGMLNQEGRLLSSGEAVATRPITFADPQMLNYLDACFSGEAAMLGYPKAEGNGIYARCRELFLNTASENKEGALEFFKFMMSEEIQNEYIDFKAVSGQEAAGWRPQLPVHMKSFEYLLEIRGKQWGNNIETIDCGNGVKYDRGSLSDEQISEFYWLLEQAQSDNWKVLNIMDIVEEELEPYFAGSIEAVEAARILDNRVQLYLDETK